MLKPWGSSSVPGGQRAGIHQQLATGKKTTLKHPLPKAQLDSPEEVAVPPVIASAPMSFLFQQRKSMACRANDIREFLPVDST